MRIRIVARFLQPAERRVVIAAMAADRQDEAIAVAYEVVTDFLEQERIGARLKRDGALEVTLVEAHPERYCGRQYCIEPVGHAAAYDARRERIRAHRTVRPVLFGRTARQDGEALARLEVRFDLVESHAIQFT